MRVSAQKLGHLPTSTGCIIKRNSTHCFGLLSFLTPPVAVAAFAAASIARADPLAAALQAMRSGWMAYIVSFLFIYSPALIMQGEQSSNALAVTTALIGVYLVSIGGFVVAGLAALPPADLFPYAIHTNIARILVGGLLIVLELRRRRAAGAGSVEPGPGANESGDRSALNGDSVRATVASLAARMHAARCHCPVTFRE